MTRVGWDKFEIALLIEACEEVFSGKESREKVIRTLSKDLRQRAINNGEKIDSYFRNTNGISLQMDKMNYLLTDGKIGLPGASNDFFSMAKLRINSFSSYSKVLKEAKLQISLSQTIHAEKNMKNDFEEWLNMQRKLDYSIDEIIDIFDECDDYSLEHGVYPKSIWLIKDLNEINIFYDKITELRYFRMTHERTINCFEVFIFYYIDFLNYIKIMRNLKNHSDELEFVGKNDANINLINYFFDFQKIYKNLTFSNESSNGTLKRRTVYIYSNDKSMYDCIFEIKEINEKTFNIISQRKYFSSAENEEIDLKDISANNRIGTLVRKYSSYYELLKFLIPKLDKANGFKFTMYDRKKDAGKESKEKEKQEIVLADTKEIPNETVISKSEENISLDQYLKMTIADIPDLKFICPVAIKYKDQNIVQVEGWNDVYIAIMILLYKSNEQAVSSLKNRLIPETNNYIFTNRNMLAYMQYPHKINDNLYINLNKLPGDIIKDIKLVCKNANIDENDILFLYHDKKQNNVVVKKTEVDKNKTEEVNKKVLNTKSEGSSYTKGELKKLDFVRIPNLAYTSPRILKYKKTSFHKLSSWRDVFIDIAQLLYRDYKENFELIVNQCYNGANNPLVADSNQKHVLRKPFMFKDGLYIELNRSAKSHIDASKLLIDLVEAKYDDFEIFYREAPEDHPDRKQKLRDALSEKRFSNDETDRKNIDGELEKKSPLLYHKLYSISQIYDEPQGLSIERIVSFIGHIASSSIVIDMLDKLSWATKIKDGVYSFSKDAKPILKNKNQVKESPVIVEPNDYDKDKFKKTLLKRFSQSGMQFDSVDFDNFRLEYSNLYDEELSFNDEELEKRLRYCGFIFEERLFSAEGVINSETNKKLFDYIEDKFDSGANILYYDAIFSDLSDAFVYCFALINEKMLKSYIEFVAEKGKYYFFKNYMSNKPNVKIDHSEEIKNCMTAKGRPLSYEELNESLSHLSADVIYKEIRSNDNFIMNEKNHYFHIDMFYITNTEIDSISEIIRTFIDEDGYAIWGHLYSEIKAQIPQVIENNVYFSSLGIRNSIAYLIKDKFNFNGDIISSATEKLDMVKVYKHYASNHKIFTSKDLKAFSDELGTSIYYSSVLEEAIRVNKDTYVSKTLIDVDPVSVDEAIDSYMSDSFIPIKEIDSFLAFPQFGYEWNEFLLESYLLSYSKKFKLLNNGLSSKVAGAVVKNNCGIDEFVDVCALALAESNLSLSSKEDTLDFLVNNNFITRRSYSNLDIALTKAKRLRKN